MGCILLVAFSIFFIYKFETRWRERRYEYLEEVVENLKIKEEKFRNDVSIKRSCLDVLSTQQTSLKAMVDYTKQLTRDLEHDVAGDANNDALEYMPIMDRCEVPENQFREVVQREEIVLPTLETVIEEDTCESWCQTEDEQESLREEDEEQEEFIKNTDLSIGESKHFVVPTSS